MNTDKLKGLLTRTEIRLYHGMGWQVLLCLKPDGIMDSKWYNVGEIYSGSVAVCDTMGKTGVISKRLLDIGGVSLFRCLIT